MKSNMQITQPELESAVEQMEQIRNQATIYEQESLRLRKLCSAEESRIGTLYAERSELEKSVTEIKTRLDIIQSEFSDALVALKSAQEVTALMLSDKKAFEDLKAHTEANLALQKKENDTVADSLDNYRAELDIRQSKLKEQADKFNKNVDKLKETIALFQYDAKSWHCK